MHGVVRRRQEVQLNPWGQGPQLWRHHDSESCGNFLEVGPFQGQVPGILGQPNRIRG